MTLGPLLIDVDGYELTAEDRELLSHPLMGGVVLFARNYHEPAQLKALVAAIHSVRSPPLLVAVDHEGGRVQRFRDPFIQLPAAHLIGRQFDLDEDQGVRLAHRCGWLMAAELSAVGVDFSFAPVLDLDWGLSEVIGDRAFHREAEVVARLAGAYVNGMREAGMAATGKHFPGHGAVVPDSHVALAVDRRPYEDLLEDLTPFERLIDAGLAAVMTAHVVYDRVDDKPAGFSSRWIQGELRGRLDFRGIVFSDDLTMAGAGSAGGIPDRAQAALEAGCDALLICNDRASALEVIDELGEYVNPASQFRLVRMHGKSAPGFDELRATEHWQTTVRQIETSLAQPQLKLDA